MAIETSWSPRQEEFAERQAAARKKAAGITESFVESMTGQVMAARPEPETEVGDEQADNAYDAARQLLRSPRRRREEMEEVRDARRVKRQKDLQAREEERAREKPTAAGTLNSLSPSQFKKALTSAFSNLDVDQSAWLKEIAEQAERNAWERESKGEADSYIEDPEKHFSDQLSDPDERDEYGNLKSEYYPEDLPEGGDGT